MRGRGIAIAAGLAALSAPAAADDAMLVLAPTSRWHLSYDKQGCALARLFGEGNDAVLARFSKYAPGVAFETVLLGQTLEPEGYSFRIRFAPGDEPHEKENALFGTGPKGTSWQFSTGLIPHEEYDELTDDEPVDHALLARREAERAAEIRRFEIVEGIDDPIALELGSMTKPMKAMDVCLNDLLKSWGFDPTTERNLRRRAEPVNDPGRWVRSLDYPRDALRKGLSGSVRFRLDIDAEGNVTGCTIQSALSDPVFEEVTCRLVTERARFTPAIGATGKPVDSFWAENIIYRTSR